MSSLAPGAAGELLAKTREEAGYSLRDVADALNLPITTVEALESEDWERLPAAVFTRGYMRAYAKHLDLEPEPIVEAVGPDEEADKPIAEDVTTTPPQKFALPATLPVLVGCGVLVIGVLGWLISSPSEEQPTMSEGIASTSADVGVGEEPSAGGEPSADGEPSAGGEPSADQPLALQEQSANMQSSIDEQPPNQTPIDQEAVVQARSSIEESTPSATEVTSEPTTSNSPPIVQALSGSARRITSTGDEILEMTFTDECWVEIKDTQDGMLYENLGRPGTSWRFVGEGPFQLLLGYAAGVTLSYNGEVVALVPHTRNNVARIVLGQ